MVRGMPARATSLECRSSAGDVCVSRRTVNQPIEADYVFLPLHEAVSPGKGIYFQRYAMYWWALCPDKGLVFYNPMNQRIGRRRFSYQGAPQCNADERITRGVIASVVPFPIEVQQVPLVWVQINLSDYDHLVADHRLASHTMRMMMMMKSRIPPPMYMIPPGYLGVTGKSLLASSIVSGKPYYSCR